VFANCLEEVGGEVGVGVVVGTKGLSPLGQEMLERKGSPRKRVGTLPNELPAGNPHALARDPMLYHVEPHLLYQRQKLRRLGGPRVDARCRDGVVGVGDHVEVLAAGVQLPRPMEPRVNREELAV
jgi:hypothetical protein